MKRKIVLCRTRRTHYFFIWEVLNVTAPGLNSPFIKTNWALILVSTSAWFQFSPFTENPANILWCLTFSSLFWWLPLLRWEVRFREAVAQTWRAVSLWVLVIQHRSSLRHCCTNPDRTEGHRQSALRCRQVPFICVSPTSPVPADQPGSHQNKHLRLTCTQILPTLSLQCM